MALILETGPVVEPVTLTEVKAQCNVTSTDFDTLLTGLITTARQVCEQELRRSLIEQTWRKTIDAFPHCDNGIMLPYPRIISITSIVYTDTAAAPQTLATPSFTLDKESEPGWVVPAYGYDWPCTLQTINAVTITYKAGYGSLTSDVPRAIKQWILLHVDHYFENRSASIETTGMIPLPFLGGLLDPFRIYLL